MNRNALPGTNPSGPWSDAPGMGLVGVDIQKDLRRSATRGALVSVTGQLASLLIRTGSMVVLARLLTPKDFGIVTMATAGTGFLALIKDAGLGVAAVQRAQITRAEASTLFWLNFGLGALLAAVCALLAPAFVAFYGVPNLFWITISLSSCFLFNGAASQHRSMLQRSMRFGSMAVIDITALVASISLAIAMAASGFGYWALVGMAVTGPAVAAVGAWLATRWVPSLPQWRSEITSMVMYGGTVTLSSVISYLAYNVDKVLLGRFWGAGVLGVYSRAYALSNVANENLFSSIGSVAFPALSRLQHEPQRFRSYFLKGYGAFLALVLPITAACALFATDIIAVMLGPKWLDAIKVFRWLSPTILGFGLIHPFYWVMMASGRAGRCVKTALLTSVFIIVGDTIGIRWGSQGVAAGFSISMMLAAFPVILWAKQGTLISAGDVLATVARPLASVAIGSLVFFLSRGLINSLESPLPRLFISLVLFFAVHFFVLVFVLNQRSVYLALLREVRLWPPRKPNAESAMNTVPPPDDLQISVPHVGIRPEELSRSD